MKRSELRQLIREEIQKLNEAKYPFDDIKVGTYIYYDDVVYAVTELYPGGFLMEKIKRGKKSGMDSLLQHKAKLEQDNYEKQVKLGLITKVK